MFEKDHGDAPGQQLSDGNSEFEDLWPSESRGDGRARDNNLNPGGQQGEASQKLKAPCKQCGFLLDLNRDDYSGGSLDGNGAGGKITLESDTVTTVHGDSHTESVGNQAASAGAGCPLCFSKNGAASAASQRPVMPQRQTGVFGF